MGGIGPGVRSIAVHPLVLFHQLDNVASQMKHGVNFDEHSLGHYTVSSTSQVVIKFMQMLHFSTVSRTSTRSSGSTAALEQ